VENKKDRRTSPDQLIQTSAIDEMLSKEPFRPVPSGKSYSRFIDDSVFLEWLDELHIPTTFYTENSEPKDFLALSDQIKPLVLSATLERFGHYDASPEVLEHVVDYLQTNDTPMKSDIIIVHGSKDIDRIELGVDLFRRGFGRRILITGKGTNYEDGIQKAEAEIFRNHALKMGLTTDTIVIEPHSVNMADNVKRSLILMEEMKIAYTNLICVISWFACRRALSLWQLFTPEGIKSVAVSPENLLPGDRLSKDNWWRNEFGVSIIFGEFVKMGFTKRYNK
jgi:hypothetical protein